MFQFYLALIENFKVLLIFPLGIRWVDSQKKYVSASITIVYSFSQCLCFHLLCLEDYVQPSVSIRLTGVSFAQPSAVCVLQEEFRTADCTSRGSSLLDATQCSCHDDCIWRHVFCHHLTSWSRTYGHLLQRDGLTLGADGRCVFCLDVRCDAATTSRHSMEQDYAG